MSAEFLVISCASVTVFQLLSLVARVSRASEMRCQSVYVTMYMTKYCDKLTYICEKSPRASNFDAISSL